MYSYSGIRSIERTLRQRGKKDQPPKLLWLKNVVNFFFLGKCPKFGFGRTTRNGEKNGDGLRARTGNLLEIVLEVCPFNEIHKNVNDLVFRDKVE